MSHSHPGYVLRTDLDAVIHGVMLERVIIMPTSRFGRIEAVCLASIPQEIWLDPRSGIDWLPDRAGSLNLAACILDCWLPAEAGQVADYEGRPVCCRQVVVDLAPRFTRDIITRVPYWGGMIDRDLIARWLMAQPGLSPLAGIDLGELPELVGGLPDVAGGD